MPTERIFLIFIPKFTINFILHPSFILIFMIFSFQFKSIFILVKEITSVIYLITLYSYSFNSIILLAFNSLSDSEVSGFLTLFWLSFSYNSGFSGVSGFDKPLSPKIIFAEYYTLDFMFTF